MPITDPVHALWVALVAIWNADPELRTLFNRTSGLVRAWDGTLLDGPLPVLTYTPLTERPEDFTTRRVSVQVSAFAADRATASAAIARAVQVVTNPTLAARGVDGCLAPDEPPVRVWLDPDASPDDPANARADVTLTLLIAA